VDALNRFWNMQACFDSVENIERLTFEVCEDSYNDGVRLLELRYSPKFIQINHDNLSISEIHSAVVKGIKRAQSKYSIGVGLIGVIDRNKPLEEAKESIDFMIEHKSDFIGVDLANDEQNFDAQPFAELFKKAKKKWIERYNSRGRSLR